MVDVIISETCDHATFCLYVIIITIVGIPDPLQSLEIGSISNRSAMGNLELLRELRDSADSVVTI